MLTMIWPIARNGSTRKNLRTLGRWIVSRWTRGTPDGHRIEERPAGDPLPWDEPAELADRRRDVGQDAIVERPPRHHPTDGDDRHGIQRMSGHRAPVCVAHHLRVAVIRGDDEERARAVRIEAVQRLDSADDPAQALVDDPERGYRRLPDAGVADHVGVREVGDDE